MKKTLQKCLMAVWVSSNEQECWTCLAIIQNYTINKYIYIDVYQLVFRYLCYLGQQIYQIRNTLLSGQVSCFRQSAVVRYQLMSKSCHSLPVQAAGKVGETAIPLLYLLYLPVYRAAMTTPQGLSEMRIFCLNNGRPSWGSAIAMTDLPNNRRLHSSKPRFVGFKAIKIHTVFGADYFIWPTYKQLLCSEF